MSRFKNFPSDSFQALTQALEIQEFNNGQIIVHKNCPETHLLIKSGKVDVMKDGIDIRTAAFLFEENKKLEEEFGEPLDLLEEDFVKSSNIFLSISKTSVARSSPFCCDEPDYIKKFSPEGTLIGATFLKLIEKMTKEASN